MCAKYKSREWYLLTVVKCVEMIASKSVIELAQQSGSAAVTNPAGEQVVCRSLLHCCAAFSQVLHKVTRVNLSECNPPNAHCTLKGAARIRVLMKYGTLWDLYK